MNFSTKTGEIGWIDLTTEHATQIRDFYQSVVGWDHEAVSMGEYNDFNMHPADDTAPVTGICHTRGSNVDFPSQWMIYINVDDLDSSLEACTASGGEIVAGPFTMGETSTYAVIKDPAGAVCALFQQ